MNRDSAVSLTPHVLSRVAGESSPERKRSLGGKSLVLSLLLLFPDLVGASSHEAEPRSLFSITSLDLRDTELKARLKVFRPKGLTVSGMDNRLYCTLGHPDAVPGESALPSIVVTLPPSLLPDLRTKVTATASGFKLLLLPHPLLNPSHKLFAKEGNFRGKSSPIIEPADALIVDDHTSREESLNCLTTQVQIRGCPHLQVVLNPYVYCPELNAVLYPTCVELRLWSEPDSAGSKQLQTSHDQGILASPSSNNKAVQNRVSSSERGIILVSHSSLSAGASDFETEKKQQGFSVHSIVFSEPLSAEMVREMIRDVYLSTGARFLILLGDVETIPTFFDGTIPSDLPYSLMDPDEGFDNYLGRDLITGRISLKSNSEIADYVQKLRTFVQMGRRRHRKLIWISQAYLLSHYDIAEQGHLYTMRNFIPADYENVLLFRGIGSASQLTELINSGVDGVVYNGHGGGLFWRRYNYDAGDLRTLLNTCDPPIIFSYACSTATFTLDRCFGEMWLQTTARGIAFIGSSSPTSSWVAEAHLERLMFQAMWINPRSSIGEALETGLFELERLLPNQSPQYHKVMHILGDPTVSPFGEPEFRISSPSPLPLAYTRQTNEIPLQAVDGEPPYRWSLTNGMLPQGMTLDTMTGKLTGMPSEPGVFPFTVAVTDSAVPPRTVSKGLTLYTADRLSIITPSSMPTGTVGRFYSVSLLCTGGKPAYQWSIANCGYYAERQVSSGWLGGGTPQNWRADDSSWLYVLPWPFPFYMDDGHPVVCTSAWISSNGFLDFHDNSSAPENYEADLAGACRVAPYWDDLRTDGPGEDIFVAETDNWVAIRWAAHTYAGNYPVNTEVILFRNGNIQFNYGEAHQTVSATIGISKGDWKHYTFYHDRYLKSIPAFASSLFEYYPPIPPGLTLHPTRGVLEGTPQTAGDYLALFRVIDSADTSQITTKEFSIRITEPPRKPASPTSLRIKSSSP